VDCGHPQPVGICPRCHRGHGFHQRIVAGDGSTPFAEVPPPTSEKLYLPMDATTEAIVEITIKTRGLGAIDPPTRRAPSAKDLHQVAELLTRRVYQFHSEI
jgi:hypothetical protein